MKEEPQRWSMWCLSLAAVCLLALAVGVFETTREEGFNPTAMVYVDAARHLRNGQGISTTILFTSSVPKVPSPLSVWPPVYPIAIAATTWLGIDAAVAARLISLLAFSASVLLVWLLARSTFGSGAASAALLVTIWPAMTRVAANAWSESLFVMLLLLSVFITTRVLRSGQAGVRTAAAGGLAMAAVCLTRYAALPLIPIGAVLILWLAHDARWQVRLVKAIAWASAAGIPVALWLARNLLVTGGLIGSGRDADDLGVLYHVTFASRTVISDLLGLLGRLLVVPELVGLEADAMALIALPVIGLPLVFLLRRRQGWGHLADGARAATRSPEARFVLLMALGYWGAMIVARSTIGFYPLDSRLMMPVYPLVVVTVVAVVGAVLERASPRATHRSGLAVAVASLTAVLVLIVPRSLASGGPRLGPEPAPVWVRWVADHTPPGALIVGNLSFDYNFYLQRPVVEFSSNRFGISKFDCQAISALLTRLNVTPAYFVLRADRGRFDPSSIGALYGSMLEKLLTGETRLPLRPLVRQPQFAAYEVLSSQWPCQ